MRGIDFKVRGTDGARQHDPPCEALIFWVARGVRGTDDARQLYPACRNTVLYMYIFLHGSAVQYYAFSEYFFQCHSFYVLKAGQFKTFHPIGMIETGWISIG